VEGPFCRCVLIKIIRSFFANLVTGNYESGMMSHIKNFFKLEDRNLAEKKVA
jgi:hypothetical protein